MKKSVLAKVSLYAFFLVSAVNLINQLVKIHSIDMITKPLLMITLLLFYLTSRAGKTGKLTWLIIGALGFSWLGDVLLMLQGTLEGLFIFGLAAFLLAHILYIFAYRLAKDKDKIGDFSSFIRTRLVFLVLIGAALIYTLYPILGDLRIPVIVYTIVIITMGISALLRRGYTPEGSFTIVYGGAILFIMSDAVLAINKFLSPVAYADLIIMATYIGAQFMIVKGILIHELNKGEEEGAKEA